MRESGVSTPDRIATISKTQWHECTEETEYQEGDLFLGGILEE